MARSSQVDGQPPTPAATDPPPRDASIRPSLPPSIPDYELLRRIGRGSYGDVWLARNVLGQFRAVKIIYRQRFADPRPFEREFEGIQRFEPISRSHPSQLHILHVGKNDAEGCFYYVMELADAAEPGDFGLRRHDSALATSSIVRKATTGSSAQEKRSRASAVHIPGRTRQDDSGPDSNLPSSTLDAINYLPHTLRHDLERHGRLPIADCVHIGLSLATALAHLHEQGLVHRDIKPSNIIFVKGVAKLGDIGLVTEAGDTQSIVGTEGYLPPEGPGTPQADLFSLGKVLYEISTGMDRRRFAELPEDLRTWSDRAGVIEFNEVVLRACAKDPAQRHQTAEQLRADLALMQEGKSVKRAHQREQLWRWVRRGTAAVFIGAAALTLIVLASRGRQSSPAPQVEKRSTNQVANRLYDLGRYYLEKNTRLDLDRARSYFEQATNVDPAFAPPYGGLSMICFWTHNDWNADWKVVPKELALQGIALDASLPEPHILLGWIHALHEWNWPAAQRELERAIELDPGKGASYHVYAECLRMQGRTSEAIANMTCALALEPTSIIFQRRFTDHLIAARRFEEAIKQADQAIAMEPSVPAAVREFRSRALCALGRYKEAIGNDRIDAQLSGKAPEQISLDTQEVTTAYEREGPRGFWRVHLRWEATDTLY